MDGFRAKKEAPYFITTTGFRLLNPNNIGALFPLRLSAFLILTAFATIPFLFRKNGLFSRLKNKSMRKVG